MSEFINTIDVLGDDAVIDSIIQRTITEFKDNRVNTVGAYAFHSCPSLIEVDMPNVTYIGANAFNTCISLERINFPSASSLSGTGGIWANCSSLKDINLPKITNIGQSCFHQCTGLKRVCFPKLQTLGSSSIRQCTSLEFVDLPSANSLGKYTMYGNTNMTTLILRSESLCSLVENTCLTNTPIASGTGYIYVPRTLVDSYKVATNWSTYADQFRALEDYTVDGTITGELDETKI